MPRRRSRVLIFLSLVFVMLTGCRGSGRGHSSVVLEEEVVLRGIVQAADLSAIRRGSHVLFQEGKAMFYIESPVVNLRAFEGQEVTLRGTIQPTTGASDIPLLVVQEREAMDQPPDGERRVVPIHFPLSFAIPSSWSHEEQEGEVRFFLPSEHVPSLILQWGEAMPAAGELLSISGRPALRVLDESTGDQRVSVRVGDRILLFLFMAARGGDEGRLAFFRLLQTVVFLVEPGSRRSTEESEGTGSPCGGPGGVLCSQGEYCAVESREANIGWCRPLSNH